MMVVFIRYLGKGSGFYNAVHEDGVLFIHVGVSSQPPHAPYPEEFGLYRHQFQLVNGPLQRLGWTFPITLQFCKHLTPIFTQLPTHIINIYFFYCFYYEPFLTSQIKITTNLTLKHPHPHPQLCFTWKKLSWFIFELQFQQFNLSSSMGIVVSFQFLVIGKDRLSRRNTKRKLV